MFSLLGVSPDVVGRLRDEHHIYMTNDSRMNLAGIMPHNAAYVAESIVSAQSKG
jgi:aspartate/tyrosine/aromatic aminotransferase